MADDKDVSHEVAAVVVEKKTVDGETHFMTRYVNLVAWWPVLTTLLILSANIGVYIFFHNKDLDVTYFMGFEDYAATTVLGAIPFLAFGAALFIVVQIFALPIYLFIEGTARKVVPARRQEQEAERYAAALRLACIALVAIGAVFALALVADGKLSDSESNFYLPIYAIAALFLLSFVIRPMGPFFQRVSLLLLLTGLLFAPGLSAYLYFAQFHSAQSDYSVDMKSVKDFGDGNWAAQCSTDNRVLWMGTKALVIACGPGYSKYLIIANPESEHVSRHGETSSQTMSGQASSVSQVSASEPSASDQPSASAQGDTSATAVRPAGKSSRAVFSRYQINVPQVENSDGLGANTVRVVSNSVALPLQSVQHLGQNAMQALQTFVSASGKVPGHADEKRSVDTAAGLPDSKAADKQAAGKQDGSQPSSPQEQKKRGVPPVQASH